jgi:glycosyltransferase involved in cell wall biosynthesis
MDEDEIATRTRLADLQAANGAESAARIERMDADKYRALELGFLGRFDLTVLASEGEVGPLAGRNPGARFAVVPNSIRLPDPGALQSSPREADGVPRIPAIDFLLVGTLGYYPNVDAAIHLCREIGPLLARGGAPARIAVVGRAPPPALRDLSRIEGVLLQADVPDVAPYYAAAKVAVVPIRAGGGSRIKILEAFAHGLPVVSTSLGAEGLEVEHGRHLLIADGAEAFAAAALRLRDDRILAALLVAEARRLLAERYGFEVAAARIESLAQRLAGMIDCAGEGPDGPAEEVWRNE